MERIVHQIKTREEWLALKAKDLTSTEVAALFGISPYATYFELWHRKKGSIVIDFKENERSTWGNRLESAIADGIAEDNRWIVRPFKDYINIRGLRIGSSFDYRVYDPETFKPTAILEIKNVDSLIYKDNWIVDKDELEAPPHIELQIQHQMLVSGSPSAHLGVLVGGNKVTIINRKADEAIHNAILKKAAEFWESIDKNIEPAPDFVKDAGFISKLYGFAEPGKVMDAAPEMADLADAYKQATAAIKELQASKDAAKSQLLTMIGDSEKVLGNSFTISAGMVGETHVEYDRKPYRNFRISFKKIKENINARKN